MFGRLLGGVSTSLLFSAFESWLVAEHFSKGYNGGLLGDVFSKAVFLGAGLMAILSGLVGNALVEDLKLGPVGAVSVVSVNVPGGLNTQSRYLAFQSVFSKAKKSKSWYCSPSSLSPTHLPSTLSVCHRLLHLMQQ